MVARINITKRSKYGNRKTQVDGIVFDSAAEAARWGELCIMQRAGVIFDLQRQVEFKFVVNKVAICSYRSDFTYRCRAVDGNGVTEQALVVEDVKGFRTKEYLIKKKLMLACYGIEILETKITSASVPSRRQSSSRPRRQRAHKSSPEAGPA